MATKKKAKSQQAEYVVKEHGQLVTVETRTGVKPLLRIMEKARAVGPALNDFCRGAYVPDPVGFILANSNIGTTTGNIGFNLLSEASGLPNPIAEVMAPVNAALNALRAHRPYVPLAKRPQPYVIKGSSEGPGGRPTVPEAPEPAAPRMKTIEEALAEPYTIKGDSSGIRTWQAAAEMNMAKALMQADESAEQ